MPATDPPAVPEAPALVVVGASIRAWAASARRAGWLVRGADLFADRDLLSIAEATAVAPEDYPAGLAAAVARFPPGPWCYCGALENAPDLVDSLAAARPLAGCPGAVLRRVRSPRLLAAALAAAGILSPETRDDPLGLPTDGTWLVKPRRSAAGRGIGIWSGDGALSAAAGAGAGKSVWQARVAGVPVSGSFVVDGEGARLVGTTEQFVGVRSWHAPPFAWCGCVDVAPDRLPDPIRLQWLAIGDALGRAFGVRGAIGVDAILSPEGRLVVLEVNPRPTASMELVDRREGGALAGDHLRACGWPGPAPVRLDRATGGTWAKAILRVSRTLDVGPRVTGTIDALSSRWTEADGHPALADLPRSGTTVPAGAPLVTLFAVGDGREEARRRLARRVATLEAALGHADGPPGR